MVVRARLALGQRLDRPALREIRRELRRADARVKAGRTLARRDVSEAALRAKLEQSGIPAPVAGETADSLRRIGALDDRRFAQNRALSLCERGWGDEAILAKLDAEGAPTGAAREAVGALPPEHQRAVRIASGLAPRKAAGLLARRGFAQDTVEAAVPMLDVEPETKLR